MKINLNIKPGENPLQTTIRVLDEINEQNRVCAGYEKEINQYQGADKTPMKISLAEMQNQKQELMCLLADFMKKHDVSKKELLAAVKGKYNPVHVQRLKTCLINTQSVSVKNARKSKLALSVGTERGHIHTS